MAFEEFKSKGGKFTPSVSINKAGGFGISSGMHHRYEVDKYIGVKLYFDKEDGRVGIKFLVDKEEGMFSLKKTEKQKGAYFAARSFWQAYGIIPESVKGRYAPEEVNDSIFGRMFVIQIPVS